MENQNIDVTTLYIEKIKAAYQTVVHENLVKDVNIDLLNKYLENKNKLIETFNNQFNDLLKEKEETQKNNDNNINQLNSSINEKDKLINDLKLRLEHAQNDFENVKNEKELLIRNKKELLIKIETLENEISNLVYTNIPFPKPKKIIKQKNLTSTF